MRHNVFETGERLHRVGRPEGTHMSMLFRVCRDERQSRWMVLVEDRLYGEYLGKDEAVADAIGAVNDTRRRRRSRSLGRDNDAPALLSLVCATAEPQQKFIDLPRIDEASVAPRVLRVVCPASD